MTYPLLTQVAFAPNPNPADEFSETFSGNSARRKFLPAELRGKCSGRLLTIPGRESRAPLHLPLVANLAPRLFRECLQILPATTHPSNRLHRVSICTKLHNYTSTCIQNWCFNWVLKRRPKTCNPVTQARERSEVFATCRRQSHLCAQMDSSKISSTACRSPRAERCRSTTIRQIGNRPWSRPAGVT